MIEHPDQISEPFRIPATVIDRGQHVCGIVAIAAAVLCVIGALVDPSRFFSSYLTSFLFVVSLAVGGIFWVLLHHLTDSGWSVVVRRLMEHVAGLAIPLSLFLLPVLIGIPTLFSWAGGSDGDAILAHKAPYLNVPFFLLRASVYLSIWAWLAWNLRNRSFAQDADRDVTHTIRLQQRSPIAMFLLAVTTTFAAFDWIMSLDAHWFSTIFGVLFWSGSILASISLVALLAVVARWHVDGVETVITSEHLHDLGKLMFGFTVFWAYIAFSQYFLIWYANLPEETVWYAARLGPWRTLGMTLAVCHFVVPFFVLLSRGAKRNPWVLLVTAAWLLNFHWLDLHWQVQPSLHPNGPVAHWLDPVTLLFCLSGAGWFALRSIGDIPVIPVGDPRLQESLRFENVP